MAPLNAPRCWPRSRPTASPRNAGVPWLGEFSLPQKKAIDAPLVGGAPWASAPAIAALGIGFFFVFASVTAMLAGMALHARLRGSRHRRGLPNFGPQDQAQDIDM